MKDIGCRGQGKGRAENNLLSLKELKANNCQKQNEIMGWIRGFL
jgi:hypothetical protein